MGIGKGNCPGNNKGRGMDREWGSGSAGGLKDA